MIVPSDAVVTGAAPPDPPRRPASPPFRAAERPPATLPFPLALAALAGAYVVAGKLGLSLAAVHPSATAIWPCTGIALAALLARGPRLWPAVFVGAFVVNATTAGTLVTALGIATGNTLEALAGAALVGRFARGRDAFARASDTFSYAALAGVACAVSATCGVLSLGLTGFAPWEEWRTIWLTWWLGDMGGALVVAPFLLLWWRPGGGRARAGRVGEAVALFAGLAVVGWSVFRWVSPLSLGISLTFLTIPPLVWAAFRFDPRTAAAAILMLAVLAVSGTLGRLGPSPRGELNESLLVLQVFLGVAAVTTVALAAVVAERRRATEAAEAAAAELREALAQLESLSHAISHDLRSPIGAVLNYIALLEEDYAARLDARGAGILERIRAATGAAARLLDQLAASAWEGAGAGTRTRVDMTALAREAFAEVVVGEGESGDVRFELGALPPAVGDPALLTRVFHNLLANAVKFTRGCPERRIAVTGEAGARENTYVVADSGIGFDPADRETLFEPFRRLSGARAIEGTGLGLAIVARIVRRYGGRVWAESEGGRGARFGFTLRNGDPDG